MTNKALIQKFISNFPLPLKGIHGPEHWGRVLEFGLELAKLRGADEDDVSLFAAFYDCERRKEGGDFEHGDRDALIVENLRGSLYELSDVKFEKLIYACKYHAKGLVNPDPTIGTCWDADRLDLPRVGANINTALLSTQQANALIRSCSLKSIRGYIPEFVSREGENS